MRHWLVIVVWGLGGLALAAAQQQPIFRSTTDLIQIDAVVLDKAGRPVRGLTKTDFQVFDNGRLQTISAIVEQNHERHAAPLSLDVASNTAERLLVFVLDDLRKTGALLEQRKNVARALIRTL